MLCRGSGTVGQGVRVPVGSHHGLSRRFQGAFGLFGAWLGAIWGLCPHLVCGFCFVAGSSGWCCGGYGQSVPPVLNVTLSNFG